MSTQLYTEAASLARDAVEINPRAVDRTRTPEHGRTVTRATLRKAVYACCPSLSRAQASTILNSAFDEICEALARGESVKLRSFGSFSVRSKRARVGRNPKTGVEAPITPRRVLTFKASPVLVARVDRGAIAVEDG